MTVRTGAAPAYQELADACLAHLLENPELLAGFMAATGYDGARLRAALDSDALKRGLLDHVVANEAVMLAVCERAGYRPEQFMAVWQRLNRVA